MVKTKTANKSAAIEQGGEKQAAQSASRRIGIHLSTSGGVHTGAERAHALGANTLQIFTASPRMWRAPKPKLDECTKMREFRKQWDIGPLVVHAGYLINVCSQTPEFLEKSVASFRGEVERALAVGAEYLVLHPGSHRGGTRHDALKLAAESIERAMDGLPWQDADFHVLIENTAGAEFSLGGSFEQVAELIELLRRHAPVAACLDTCHTHVAGYDFVSEEGYADTMKQVEQTIGFDSVRVWHCNDAKAARGSKLDRHQHIGEGMIGAAPFKRLLHDARFAHCAFVAETPVDAPEDCARNVNALQSLAR
jgi:deoxyribonuclease-4